MNRTEVLEMDRGVTIQEVATRMGMTAHTLRYYERAGLLDPVGRAPSGHRRYSPGDVAWIEFLIRLRVTGMPTRHMQAFADLRRRGEVTVSERRGLLEAHRGNVLAHLRAIEGNLAAIDEKIRHYRKLEAEHDGSTVWKPVAKLAREGPGRRAGGDAPGRDDRHGIRARRQPARAR